VSKPWKPGRQTVELRPSRIRRDPVRLEKVEAKPPSPEREVWVTVTGVALFAAAVAALTFGISEITSHWRNDPESAAQAARFGHCYNHAGPNCVLDGETIYFGGERVEIAGMDAPEIGGAACAEEANRGVRAAVRLHELLNSGKVTLGDAERESDGRLLRRVAVDGRDVSKAMIGAGVARDYGGGPRSWCAER
jgi:micrococcal nuclease